TTLFRGTLDAMRAQRLKASEWIVLAHGPISAELDKTLIDLEAEGLIRSIRHEVNLGIHGGLRVCLEHATGDFALSMDADDLLTPDALAILTDAAEAHPDRAIFYSDEDLLIEGEFRHPYYRPDFDPVLLFAQSYIWHTILFQRKRALHEAYSRRVRPNTHKIGIFLSALSKAVMSRCIFQKFCITGDNIRARS
ncbi:hypothetical protein BZM27_54570, partial [Paraburkholderia steynii]